MDWLLASLRQACRQQPGCPPPPPHLRWPQLIAIANWHGVAALLAWQLRGTAWQAKLDQQLPANLRRNFLLMAAAVKLLAALEQQHIPALTFKGPALAAQLYGNLGLRQVSDIDILVAPPDLAIAQRVLVNLGYEPQELLTPPQAVLRQQTNYERAWLHPRSQVNVDLHWGLAPPYLTEPIAIAPLIARAYPLTLNAQRLQVPAPADLLFILCLNGSKDGWLHLQRLCDVATCLQLYPDLDWSQLLALAEQAASWRLVGLGLYLARELLAAELPLDLQARLAADATIQRLGRAIAQRLANNWDEPLTLVQRAYFPWQLQDNRARQWRYFQGLLLPLNERDLAFAERLTGQATLPPPLSLLYHPLRWLRLALKHGGGWDAL